MTERAQVVLFLKQMKHCANCSFRFVSRDKNMATLMKLGMTMTEARSRILSMTPEDYCEGPTPRSASSTHEAWVFGLRIRGTPLYVKLDVRLDPARCVCVSFHEAEHPMRFPFRTE